MMMAILNKPCSRGNMSLEELPQENTVLETIGPVLTSW